MQKEQNDGKLDDGKLDDGKLDDEEFPTGNIEVTSMTVPNKPCYVYILECSDKSTYVGATVDLDHRLRQHNCEIKGGAVQTHRKVAMGHHWTRVCHVEGFPDWKSALQFEWAVNYYSRKMKIRRNQLPIDKRKMALHKLIHEMDRPTSKSVPYTEYVGGKVTVIWE